MGSKIRTGFYGGSFNPIHEGHLALGDFLIEHRLVDECWFVVSPQNPLKKTADPTDARFRLEAVSKALESHPGCIASDIEFRLPLPSYTVQTLRYVAVQHPDREFICLSAAITSTSSPSGKTTTICCKTSTYWSTQDPAPATKCRHPGQE